MKINLSDGNAYESYETLEEAIEQAATWYDYMTSDDETEWYGKDLPAMRTTGIASVDDLNEAITEWETELADGEGNSDFYGHGSYHVSAADQAGYRLVASEDLDDGDEADEQQ